MRGHRCTNALAYQSMLSQQNQENLQLSPDYLRLRGCGLGTRLGLQLIKSFIDLEHWQALQATLTLLIRLLSHLQAYNTRRNSELASPVDKQEASHMRIKFTVVPNYYVNSHILVYLNTGKWNEESTDYY